MQNTNNLSKNIAEKILNGIVAKEYPVGSQIPNEDELSKKYNVGRGTIREAEKILNSQNILEICRGAGTFVCENPGIMDDPFGFRFVTNPSLFADLSELRYLLEPQVASLAARRATQKEMDEMATILSQMDELVKNFSSNDDAQDDLVDTMAGKDTEFHELIFKMTHNSAIERMAPTFINTLLETFVLKQFRKRYKEFSRNSTHRLVYDAICTHDEQLAASVMRLHVEKSFRYAETKNKQCP